MCTFAYHFHYPHSHPCDNNSKWLKRFKMIWESVGLGVCRMLVCICEWMCTSVCIYRLDWHRASCSLIMVTQNEASPGWRNLLQIRFFKNWLFAYLISTLFISIYLFFFPLACAIPMVNDEEFTESIRMNYLSSLISIFNTLTCTTNASLLHASCLPYG